MSATAAQTELPRITSFDRETQRLAHVYAEALLAAALARNEIDALREELEVFFREILEVHADVRGLISTGAIGRRRRTEILEKAFRGRTSELFANFFLVLSDHERLPLFRAVAASYFAQCDQRTGRIPVQVKTAIAISDEERRKIIEKVRALFGQEPILEESVDPALIGGLVFRVGDLEYDGSIRTRLQEIRKQLIARSNYEIQSGRDRFRIAD